jgi:hypothetical protein
VVVARCELSDPPELIVVLLTIAAVFASLG